MTDKKIIGVRNKVGAALSSAYQKVGGSNSPVRLSEGRY